jgi:hypothetical protein
MPGYVYRGDQPIGTAKKPGPVPKPFDPDLCGTPKGYKQHVAFHEDACRSCLDAYATYQREWRAKRKQAA